MLQLDQIATKRTLKELSILTENVCHEHRRLRLISIRKTEKIEHEIKALENEKRRIRIAVQKECNNYVKTFCKDNNMNINRINQILNVKSYE